MQAIMKLYDEVMAKEKSVDELKTSEVLEKGMEKTEATKESMLDKHTAVLRLQYMKMIDILQKFIKAEGTGQWELNLQAVYEMLPYFAASGHNLYAKSAYLYLQMMQGLKKHNPDVWKKFEDGFHVVRRSDRYWAGLSSDLVIEQVLMRSVNKWWFNTRSWHV